MSKKKDGKLSTEELLREVMRGRNVSVPFRENTDIRRELGDAIRATGMSLNAFATESGISPAQLSEYLNGHKNMSRDRLLCVMITLRFSLKQVQDYLVRLQSEQMYLKNVRDYEIILGIRDGRTLDEINMKLEEKGFATLC